MKSASKFLESNGSEQQCFDANGNTLEGTIVTDGGLILRFYNGLLDGDVKAGNGMTASLPAVEGQNHLEWWRGGRIHRDSGLPAVVSDNLTRLEWWVNGVFKR
jgi:hypothetical protein